MKKTMNRAFIETSSARAWAIAAATAAALPVIGPVELSKWLQDHGVPPMAAMLVGTGIAGLRFFLAHRGGKRASR